MNDEETCSIGVKYMYHLDESEVQGRIYFRRYSWSFRFVRNLVVWFLFKLNISNFWNNKQLNTNLYLLRYKYYITMNFIYICIFHYKERRDNMRKRRICFWDFTNSLKQNFITHSLRWKYYNIIKEMKRYEEKVHCFFSC